MTIASPLDAWESFYVIVGSAGASLTGLQFVVMTLSADAAAGSGAVAAFGTPTVVHFCVTLFIAAVVTAPWYAAANAGIVLIASALFGVVYTLLVITHARRQKDYVPVLEDWVWHSILPIAAYLTLLVGSVLLLGRNAETALFVIAASSVLLLFIGIHNAWDAVVYTVTERIPAARSRRDKGASA